MTNEIKNIIPLSAYSFNSEASQSVVSTSSLQNVISASSENLKKIRQKFKDSFFNILCPIS